MPVERLKLSDFDYHLPKELIAQYPCARREGSRLLVLERAKSRILHRDFVDIINYFSPGDCLVLNNTKVLFARLIGRRQRFQRNPSYGGGKQEIFLLEGISKDTYRVLARPSNKLRMGARILFENEHSFATVLADEGLSKIVKFSGNGDGENFWRKLGRIPLPPYIKREAEESDKQRYQTVYAKKEGATASPTAGLHFTEGLLDSIRAKGVNVVYLTLHVNYGTFAPVKCEDITKHKMHKEYFILPRETAKIVSLTRARGKRIFAVGTTSARVVETCAGGNGGTGVLLKAARGWTDLFIYSPYKFKAVDCLLTNFHFPQSTLLMLVSAFAGRKLIFKAYREAIEKKYRFFSYGDAMLIL